MPSHRLDRLRAAHDDQRGFTLIELLVVVLIIGILAAIAVPSFVAQQKKGQNATAKSNARNAVTLVESCLANATSATAVDCGDKTKNAGLNALGDTVTVNVVSLVDGASVYSVTASSSSGSTYSIAKAASGKSTYTTTADDPRWLDNTVS